MPSSNHSITFDKTEKKDLAQQLYDAIAAEKKPSSIPFFPATASLKERSMGMVNLSFCSLSDETKALFIHDLLRNQPEAQRNMLKKQYQLDVQNILLIANEIEKKLKNKNPNLASCKESDTLEIIQDVICSAITTARPGI